MRLALQVYDKPGGTVLEDWSNTASRVTVEKNEHGTAVVRAFVPMSQKAAFHWSKQRKLFHVELGTGANVIGAARLEDPTMVDGGLSVTAYGYWRAFYDLLYTALWSDTDLRHWRRSTAVDKPTIANERYSVSSINALYFAPRKNEVFDDGHLSGIHYHAPHGGENGITEISFAFKLDAPSTWRLALVGYDDNWGSGAALWSVDGTGGLATNAVTVTVTDKQILLFFFYYLSTTPVTYAGETGDIYAEIMNIRVVTTDTNVATTIALSITAGSQTVTPADMTGIYVGQKLIIDDTSVSEMVEVTAVTASTFTATFANSYAAGATVEAPLTYADTVVGELVTYINGINPTQLHASTTLIEAPGRDLTDVSFEDERPANIVNDLLEQGDDQSPPRYWVAGVTQDRRAYFRPKGSKAQTWQVSIDDLTLNPSADGLFNEVYSTYQDDDGRTLRTATAFDADSINEHGITRQDVVKARTTSGVQAEAQRDTQLSNSKDTTPRASIVVTRMTLNREPVPLWECESGDVIEVGDLAFGGPVVDKTYLFTVKRLIYDVDNDVLKITPEEDLPEIEFMLAQGVMG